MITPQVVKRNIAALQAVEKMAPTRRSQAILTLAAVSRHYCRQEQITWSEFDEHAREAIATYHRVYTSATRRGLVSYQLNALAPLGDLCLKAIRFHEDADAREFVGRECRTNVAILNDACVRLEDIVLETQDLPQWRNIQKDRAMMRYIVALVNGTHIADLEEVQRAFDEAAICVSNETRILNAQSKSMAFKSLLTSVVRLLTFSLYYPEDAAKLKPVIAPFLRLVLKETQGIKDLAAKRNEIAKYLQLRQDDEAGRAHRRLS